MSKLGKDIGENYEYVKTILHHRIELQKLEFIEGTASVASMALMLFVCGVGFVVLLFLGLVLAITILATYLNSLIAAVGLVAGVAFVSIVVVIIFREYLLVRPIENLIYKTIENRL